MEPHASHPSRSSSSSSCHSSSLNLSSSPHFCLLLKCQMKQHQMEASRSPAESNRRRAFPHGLCGRAAIAPVPNPASPPGSACSRMARRAPQTKPPGFKQKMTPEQLSRYKKRSDSGQFHCFCSSAFTGATQDLSCSPQEQNLGLLKYRALPTLQETGHIGGHGPDLWRYRKGLGRHPER